MIRVGLGFDVHRFDESKHEFILGGVVIPAGFGVEAISDGDVLLHSLADALCGGLGLGDIGDHFPPQDKNSQGLSSRYILSTILQKAGNFRVVNADITIVADKPPLVSYKDEIVMSLREMLSTDSVNVKIKSKENLDIFGGKNSIGCISVVLMEDVKDT